jgi:tetratricopeptide (TPR) repeat protein
MKNSASAFPETICSRAAALLSSGLSDEALEPLELARDNFPTQASVASRYADALHLAGRVNEAIDAYQIALRSGRILSEGRR